MFRRNPAAVGVSTQSRNRAVSPRGQVGQGGGSSERWHELWLLAKSPRREQLLTPFNQRGPQTKRASTTLFDRLTGRPKGSGDIMISRKRSGQNIPIQKETYRTSHYLKGSSLADSGKPDTHGKADGPAGQGVCIIHASHRFTSSPSASESEPKPTSQSCLAPISTSRGIST